MTGRLGQEFHNSACDSLQHSQAVRTPTRFYNQFHALPHTESAAAESRRHCLLNASDCADSIMLRLTLPPSTAAEYRHTACLDFKNLTLILLSPKSSHTRPETNSASSIKKATFPDSEPLVDTIPFPDSIILTLARPQSIAVADQR